MNSFPVLWTVLSVQAQGVSGLPLTPTSNAATITVGWVSDAPQRGTLSIIVSCILTMGLCVWSALHLNIPSTQQGAQVSLRNVKWMLMGLLAPELVVFTAWRQYVSARTLQNKINGLAGSRSELSTATAIIDKSLSDTKPVISRHGPDWTLAHSFYAGMGGFVFNSHTISALGLLPSNLSSERLTLTPRGIALLAECGLVPNVSKEEIGDKSKADGLAKALVCLQAAWMVIQVVGRLAYRLPVTLLEINTIGHVICAFVIYILWWHKPKLINEPTSLNGQWVEAVCAYMWMSSRLSDPHGDKVSIFGHEPVPELANLAFYSRGPIGETPNLSAAEPITAVENDIGKDGAQTTAEPVTDAEDYSLPASRCYAYKECFGGLGPIPQHQSATNKQRAAEKLREGSPPPLEQVAPPERWQLALNAMQMFPAICKRLKVETDNAQYQRSRFDTEELLCDRAGNWPSDGLLNSFRGLIMGMVLWFASMAFGAVHAAAWNEYFPSTLECWLWRSCSVYVMASGFLWLCINFLGQLSRPFDQYWDKVLARGASWFSYVIIGSLCTVCGMAYAFARIFLITEAVISLRRLPTAAYDTPDWSQLIPHL